MDKCFKHATFLIIKADFSINLELFGLKLNYWHVSKYLNNPAISSVFTLTATEKFN